MKQLFLSLFLGALISLAVFHQVYEFSTFTQLTVVQRAGLAATTIFSSFFVYAILDIGHVYYRRAVVRRRMKKNLKKPAERTERQGWVEL